MLIIILIARSKEAADITDKLNLAIDSINGWFSSVNLKIAFDKCFYVFLGHETVNIRQGSFSIRYDSHFIPNSKEFKYLGTWWSSDMSWEKHISNTVESMRLGSNMLSYLCKRKWGIQPSIAVIFYESLVRPRADWASFLFAGARQFLLKKLDVVQNAALRSYLGCIKTTPLNVLHHL